MPTQKGWYCGELFLRNNLTGITPVTVYGDGASADLAVTTTKGKEIAAGFLFKINGLDKVIALGEEAMKRSIKVIADKVPDVKVYDSHKILEGTTSKAVIYQRPWASSFVERVNIVNKGNMPLTIFDIALVDGANKEYGCNLGDIDLYLNTPGAPWICGDGQYAKGHLPPVNETRFASCAYYLDDEEVLRECVHNSTRLVIISPGASFPVEITFAPLCDRLNAGTALRMWTDIGTKEIMVTATLEEAERKHCMKILEFWSFEKNVSFMAYFLSDTTRVLLADTIA